MIISLQHRNDVLTIDHSPLITGAVNESYLTAQGASGVGTLTVKNITGFAINQILLVGELGNENAEIILTHASTAPSGTTVTLASNLARTHAVGTRVRVILFNQYELSHAVTATGSKTLLTVSGGEPPSSLGSGLVAIDPSVKHQKYHNTEFTSGFYFARYKDSVAGTFGGYTDALAYGGWDANTVGAVIEQALDELDLNLSDKITKHSCYRWLTDGLNLIKGKQLRWPEHYSFNEVIGQTTRGINTVAMPTGAYDTETNKSLLAVRIGHENNKLDYLDPIEFEEYVGDIRHTQVRTEASAAATTLEIDNSYDFKDSGTVNIYISGVKYSITYTGVTRSSTAGILTGVPASGTGSITVTIPVGTNVWQSEDEGQPLKFTVRGGNIEFWPIPNATWDNMNIYADYNKVVTVVDSDSDVLDFQRGDALTDYLTWRIWCKAKNDNKLDTNNGYWISFKEKLNDAIRTLPRNIRYKRSPNINRMQK